MAPIDGALIKELVLTLTEAFPSRFELEELTQYYLNTPLDEISIEGNNLRAVAFGIVKWCQAQGGNQLEKLIEGAIRERPNRHDLYLLKTRLVPAQPVSTTRSANNLIAFSQHMMGWLQKYMQAQQSLSELTGIGIPNVDNSQWRLMVSARLDEIEAICDQMLAYQVSLDQVRMADALLKNFATGSKIMVIRYRNFLAQRDPDLFGRATDAFGSTINAMKELTEEMSFLVDQKRAE